MFSSTYRSLSVIILLALVPTFLSCGREQQLVFITIEPATETFGASNIPVGNNAGSSVQLRALGSYIHPPVTKDITNQVTWASNTIDIATVSPTGILTATGFACGGALISATLQTNHSIGDLHSSGAIVTSFMTANVVCFTGTGPAITVNFAGGGTGTITSSPSGLGCASTCTASFPAGTTVTLTATPSGTFGSWVGCDLVSGRVCTIVNLTGDRSLIVTFN